MLVAAAVVPTPPLLVPEIAGGSARADQELRSACHDAIDRVLRYRPERIVVVGPAPTTGWAEGSWDWRGFGVASPAEPASGRLPLALAIGAWLLEQVDRHAPRPRLFGISADATPSECAQAGADLVRDEDTALIVCGDGSASRDVVAPGYLDPDAHAWDDDAIAALEEGHAKSLLSLDATLARRILAAGRPAWQVLAGVRGHRHGRQTVSG
jgi:hypothetical protein